MAGYYGDHPALELINSEHWYGRRPLGGADLLDEPGWLPGYLARWKLTGAGEPTRAERARIVALRALMRRAFTQVARGDAPSAGDVEELNRFLSAAPLRRVAARRDGRLAVAVQPLARNWRWVLSEVADQFVELLATAEPGRLKLCENPECLCAFHDRSRNRRRRWCYPEVCGNLDKVRRFRERARERRAPADSASRRASARHGDVHERTGDDPN